MSDTGVEVAGVAGSLDSQVTCHPFVSVTDDATQGGVDMRIALFSPRLKQQQQKKGVEVHKCCFFPWLSFSRTHVGRPSLLMAAHGADGGTGSARRRRERRLRTVAEARAAIDRSGPGLRWTHHSFDKVGTASGVLRNRKTATRTGKGEEYETHALHG